jgi:hypothetical protein
MASLPLGFWAPEVLVLPVEAEGERGRRGEGATFGSGPLFVVSAALGEPGCVSARRGEPGLVTPEAVGAKESEDAKELGAGAESEKED